MFRGYSIVSLDAKGRLAIPAKYREQLREQGDTQMILTLDTAGCLLLFTESGWQQIECKLAELPAFNLASRQIQRLYIGSAQEVEMDAQGRILINQALRKRAKLEKLVAFVGQGNKFEIWNEDAWNAFTDQALADTSIDELALQAGLGSMTL